MKSPLKANRLFLVLLLAATYALQSCGKTDPGLIHKINTFRPRFSELNKGISELEGHMEITAERYPKDWGQVEPFLETAPDSLKDKDFYKAIRDYKDIIAQQESLHTRFRIVKKDFEKAIKEFGDWETEVKNGNVSKQDVSPELEKWKMRCKEIELVNEKLSGKLDSTVTLHNSMLRLLNERIGRFENQDIVWKP